jgi:class 3 adenylate cyclase
VPLGCVALMAAAILAITLYSDRVNQNGVLALSDDMVRALESRVSLAVSDYLGPAARAARISRDISRDRDAEDRRSLDERFGAVTLKEVPHIANVNFADSDGNFLLVRRGREGGTETKVIDNAPGARQVTWIYRDAQGRETGRRSDPADNFDARQRPWYKGAVTAADLFWTPPYVFYTEQQPGITVAVADQEADGRQHVYGIDITLAELAKFLGTLAIGRNGRAIIADDTGALIASPGGRSRRAEGGQEGTAERIEELGDPILTDAYDQYRIKGHGHRVIDFDGRRYITSAMALQSTGRNWTVLVVVPEDDFTGFVAANARWTLTLSLGVLAVALLLALLLIYHGLRADRSARLLLDRQGAISRQSTAFANLAVDADLFDPTRGEPPRALTQTLADATEARRVGIWRLTGDDRILRCEDIFDRDTAGHVDGQELHRDELPQLFSHLLQAEEVDTRDAAGDRRTTEAHRLMLQPLGSRALLVVPVVCKRKVSGAIWLEDAPASVQVKDFVRAAANMVALRLIDSPAPDDAGERDTAPQREAEAPSARHAELRTPPFDRERMAAEFYADATIMVLQVADPMDMALRLSDGGRAVSDELARLLQEVASQGGIPYLKIAGQQAVAAAGLSASGASAATDVADAALAARDRCAALFEESACAHDFRIGIDCGPALGHMVGADPTVFNLWGDAVRTAESMAASALPGTIQVTEAAYLRLRQHFLLRPRGRFYLPNIGEARTFVLAGRL